MEWIKRNFLCVHVWRYTTPTKSAFENDPSNSFSPEYQAQPLKELREGSADSAGYSDLQKCRRLHAIWLHKCRNWKSFYTQGRYYLVTDISSLAGKAIVAEPNADYLIELRLC